MSNTSQLRAVRRVVLGERNGLESRLEGLEAMLARPTSGISLVQVDYLKKQRPYMQGYLQILDARVRDLDQQIECECVEAEAAK